jgi:hypothetical protein
MHCAMRQRLGQFIFLHVGCEEWDLVAEVSHLASQALSTASVASHCIIMNSTCIRNPAQPPSPPSRQLSLKLTAPLTLQRFACSVLQPRLKLLVK